MLSRINYDKKVLETLKSNYFNAKALYKCIKHQAENIQTLVLLNNEFYESEEWTEGKIRRGQNKERRRIVDPFDTYLMNDADFQKYLDLTYEEYVKAGIDDKRGKEWCPEAEARCLYLETKEQLVNYGIEIASDGFEEKSMLQRAAMDTKWRDKILDLILRLESDGIKNYLIGEKICDNK